MSMIKCPSCGQEISDKAKKCVHCGKELFFCPECGKVSVRTGNICPQCGYELPAAEKPAPAPVAASTPAPAPVAKQTPKPSDPNALINAWKRANPNVKVQIIKSRVFGIISTLIVVVLFIISMLLIEGRIPPTKGIKGGNLSSAEFFARYDRCELLYNVIIGVTAALSLIAPVCKIFCDYLPSIRCAAWPKKTGYDLKPYVAEYKKNRMVGGKWTQSDQAAYYALSKNGKAAGIALCVSEFFDMLPFSIIMAVILKEACLSVMLSWQLNEASGMDIPWGLIGVAIASVVVYFVIQVPLLFVGPRFLKNYPTEPQKQA